MLLLALAVKQALSCLPTDPATASSEADWQSDVNRKQSSFLLEEEEKEEEEFLQAFAVLP